jgi:site-specific recombinase XerD
MPRIRNGVVCRLAKERAVPLTGDAVYVLQGLQDECADEEDGPVFVDDDGLPPKPDCVTHRFKFYVRKANLRDRKRLKFHSLRHTTGSWLAMRGVPMRVIQGILGHGSIQQVEQYSHLAPEVAVKAMQEVFGR